ncbi:RES family NAD+ phosphorylase [Dyadobacter arcticus]|uniref:RES domain-containing protein n=1 Tax=Dyadobacter arcticus TaxID=1078754 RepID=A0ABX0UKH7_9BACT|nr:RES family NAD+ phosphorylase [Dyadobacter arcticus]NIJ53412.1 RES domain-containing protein [Dyadobacter arcticus]
MIVYRLAAKQYINDFLGTGAKLFGGRWNPVGHACIYTSEQISLALLEKFVHASHKENMERIALLRIEIPDDKKLIFQTDENLLKKDWMDDISYSQWIGKQILADSTMIAFTVPSAIVPAERNVVINPQAKAFGQVKFLPAVDFNTDFRLLSKLLS